MNFGRNLKRLRQIKNATVLDVSVAVGVSEENYAAWESGEKEPELNELCLLAEYFIITVDNILDAAFDYTNYLRLLKAKGLLD
ncbi:helix-turn-helix domain-containing protein [Anaerovibrio sp.]|uniref:helix-turn-helix domain-containing protein n=1 Tax=Anaerovibrio sp. TaxID=1872532 RepID=UPI003890D0B1